MASTYPLEIVQAARWMKKRPASVLAALEAALQAQDWDPIVKSLCGLPDVLERMNDNLDWTQDLGDAWPATYGSSGVMTFLVNRQGIAFQADLGPDTARAAADIASYDPGERWTPTSD